MKLTENISRDECAALFESARPYGEQSLRGTKMTKVWRKKKCVIMNRVNTPEKIPALYIYFKNDLSKDKNNPGFNWLTFLVVEGAEGKSYLGRMRKDFHHHEYLMIKSHVFSRYAERHGWAGSREDLEEYILVNALLLWYDIDKYTGEVNAYFDDGMFLGYLKDGICYINTYVNEKTLYRNQKIKAKWQQLKLDDAKRNADYLFDPQLKNMLEQIKCLQYEGLPVGK